MIRNLVTRHGLDVQIIPVPTVREPDGLAVSSRNAYLSEPERRAAGPVALASMAIRIGNTRLIDNVLLGPEDVDLP